MSQANRSRPPARAALAARAARRVVTRHTLRVATLVRAAWRRSLQLRMVTITLVAASLLVGAFGFLVAKRSVDILLANESEIIALYEGIALEDAIARVRGDCDLTAVTRSEHGSVIVSKEHALRVAADPVEQVIDTTGAGDMYAAGFLLGIAHREPLERCARMASIAAAEVISHFGARRQAELASVVTNAMAT